MLYSVTSLVTQMLKNLPAMQETWFQSLGWEDPLKKGMAIHSSILAWRIPWTEEPGGHSPRGCKQSDTTEMTECVLTVARQAPLWDFPGRNNRVDYHFLVQGIFLAQGSNPGLLHCRQIL